ncbi:hypothetical protein OKW50_008062 [Paraburkholderia youngii]
MPVTANGIAETLLPGKPVANDVWEMSSGTSVQNA